MCKKSDLKVCELVLEVEKVCSKLCKCAKEVSMIKYEKKKTKQN